MKPVVLLAGLTLLPISQAYSDDLPPIRRVPPIRPITPERPVQPIRPIPPVRPIEPVRPIRPIDPGRNRLQPIQVSPELTEVIRKGQGVGFRPFAMKDPNSGGGAEERAQPVAPSAMLTFPDGKKVPAGKYYEELNRFEQHVNQFGYTLREDGDATIPFSQIIVDRPEFERKKGETLRKHDPSRMKRRLPVTDIRKSHDGEVARLPEYRRAIDRAIRLPIGVPPKQPKTFSASKGWSDSWGWSNKFAAFVDTNLALSGTSTQTNAKGEGNAGGYLFGQKLQIIRGEAKYTTPKDGDLVGDVAFYFLGYKIFSKNYKSPSAFFHNDEWSQGLDESTTIYFTLGPIPMSAKLGAQGNASLEYRMGMLPLRANADIEPNVQSKVYIQVGVDLAVGGAGGGSNLILLNDRLSAVGRLHLLVDSKGAYFSSDINASNEMTALAGRVYAYVFVYVPRWGIPPWKKKQWDWTLFNLAGIKANGSLFDLDQKVYLF